MVFINTQTAELFLLNMFKIQIIKSLINKFRTLNIGRGINALFKIGNSEMERREFYLADYGSKTDEFSLY
jgi:hypothetical protein